ncbi:hypothetical protein [Streptomyces fructofermentans]|uniref:Uncharacterized protein n=1 Tax=Streptomyces fructofermentans TaxID=152141 RepID=A0A918K1W2_9ACTN|nr:hypothetical protein [Streptomyces fructofermentans]GGX44975.1 hypothetical protein GCM10010515_09860 [Streptomyces fructofermentans]
MENEEAYAAWGRHKPSTKFAVDELATLLGAADESAEAVFSAYLFAKKDLARSMQELLRATLPLSRPGFEELRSRVRESLQERFGDRIPEKYLAVPYDSVACQDLFGLLRENMGKPVDTAVLRALNADDVHTERRIRELRELGLRIDSVKRDGVGCYLLASLDLDPAQMSALVAKAIKKASLTEAEQKQLIAALDA